MDSGALISKAVNLERNYDKPSCAMKQARSLIRTTCRLVGLEPHIIDGVIAAFNWDGKTKERIKKSTALRMLDISYETFNRRRQTIPAYQKLTVFKETPQSHYLYLDEVDALLNQPNRRN